ncbi:hypothetical protein [Caenimonas sp. SL110]|uniref:hypothetical protein n=1 Tax=Caenimonas sp. SL110 TaxID=1450524 RepID=UPI00128D73F2|nr:hypothetical protein [Caenimonas sp. SL110]
MTLLRSRELPPEHSGLALRSFGSPGQLWDDRIHPRQLAQKGCALVEEVLEDWRGSLSPRDLFWHFDSSCRHGIEVKGPHKLKSRPSTPKNGFSGASA